MVAFNCGIQLWNTYLPIFESETVHVNENVLPVLNELFEAINNAIIYYESINAEIYDNEHFKRLDFFVDISAIYAKLLENRSRSDECIRVCDTALQRKLKSNHRKIFDTIKSKALRSDKKGNAKPTGSKQQNKKEAVSYTPSADQILLSECFANLEAAVLTKEEKAKLEILKKGIDGLKNYKINPNDESTIQINAEQEHLNGHQRNTKL